VESQGSSARFEDVTVRDGRRIVCENVSLSVGPGNRYVLLGRDGVPTALLQCLTGARTPSAGRVEILGRKPGRRRHEVQGSIRVVDRDPGVRFWTTPRRLAKSRRVSSTGSPQDVAARLTRLGVPLDTRFSRLTPVQRSLATLALALETDDLALLLLDEPAFGDTPARSERLRELANDLDARGAAALLATGDPAGVEEFATHVGILKEGRLVADAPLETLRSRFRRLRYANEISPDRTEYGNELDEFDAVRVRVRGWGVEAIVSNFAEDSFARLRKIPGLDGAQAETLSLDEIFLAAVGERRPEPRP
jgi:ABC-2 type transport system ATP-binding protein